MFLYALDSKRYDRPSKTLIEIEIFQEKSILYQAFGLDTILPNWYNYLEILLQYRKYFASMQLSSCHQKSFKWFRDSLSFRNVFWLFFHVRIGLFDCFGSLINVRIFGFNRWWNFTKWPFPRNFFLLNTCIFGCRIRICYSFLAVAPSFWVIKMY